MPSVEKIIDKGKMKSVSSLGYFTWDEKEFLRSAHERRGMQWLLKYRKAMPLRKKWDKIDRGEIECYVDSIIAGIGATTLTCK